MPQFVANNSFVRHGKAVFKMRLSGTPFLKITLPAFVLRRPRSLRE
jgi:hypothetical protein